MIQRYRAVFLKSLSLFCSDKNRFKFSVKVLTPRSNIQMSGGYANVGSYREEFQEIIDCQTKLPQALKLLYSTKGLFNSFCLN